MKLKKMNLSKKVFTLVILFWYSVASFSQATVDLSQHTTTPPLGSAIEWHSSLPVSSLNRLMGTAITAASKGVYYVVYTDGALTPCYSPSMKVSVANNTCPLTTVDLTSYSGVSPPNAGYVFQWHTTSSPSSSDLYNSGSVAIAGSYFGFYYNSLTSNYVATNEMVIVVTNSDISPLLSVNSPICNGTSLYDVTFSSNGIVTASVGTVVGSRIVDIPVGTNVIVTASPASGCGAIQKMTVVSPLSCLPSAPCLNKPSLSASQGVCGGSGFYSVSFSTSAIVSVNTGTITGNIVSGIALGTDVILTATEGNCSTQITVVAPTDCSTSCSSSKASFAVGKCNGGTYSIQINNPGGSIITASTGIVTATAITGIVVGINVDITVTPTDSSCVPQMITMTSPTCFTLPIIIATADAPSALPGDITPSVILNDTLYGLPAIIGSAAGNVKLTSSPSGPLTMNADGTIAILMNAPAGVYSINYTICEINNPTNCSQATARVTVLAPIIIATADAPSALPGGTTPSVILNDTLKGLPVIIGTAAGSVKLTSTPSGPLTMNADGTIAVVANSPAGVYPINYTICEINNPTNCSQATARVTVLEVPKITLVKTGVFNNSNSDNCHEIGDKITYSFTIQNVGNVPLTNVMVTDLLPGVLMTGTPIILAIGESNTIAFSGVYTLTREDMIYGQVSNQATVSGKSPSGAIVTHKSDFADGANENPTVLDIKGCIEVFNAVSMNEDGMNDVFYIQGLERYPDNSVEIYNRWGVLVFEKIGYNNSDRAFRGISEGRMTIKESEKLPVGTYFYIFKYKDSASTAHEKAGYLYLNR